MSDTYIEPQEQMKIIEALQFVAQKSKQYINKKIEQIELIPGPDGPIGPEGPMGPQGEKGDPGDTPELAEWVLAPEKPEYTAEEVGALPADTVIPKEDFVAEFGVTKFQEIMEAHNAGRRCWVKKDGQFALFYKINEYGANFYLDSDSQGFIYGRCDNQNFWFMNPLNSYQTTSNMVNEISEDARSYKYPSEKAVADALKTVLPTVTTADAGKFLRVSAEGLWTAEFLMDVSEVGA